MIAFPRALLEALVLRPQGDDSVVAAERLAYLDPDALPIDVAPQALAILDVTTDPIGYEVGEGFSVRHRLDVAVSVGHGSLTEARRLRNLIVFDLCARADGIAPAFLGASDPDTGQELSRLRWSVDWRPLTAGDDNVSECVVEFTIDADVHPQYFGITPVGNVLTGHGAPPVGFDWQGSDTYVDLDTGTAYRAP